MARLGKKQRVVDVTLLLHVVALGWLDGFRWCLLPISAQDTAPASLIFTRHVIGVRGGEHIHHPAPTGVLHPVGTVYRAAVGSLR